MTYKVTKTVIYFDGELCSYDYNYADYSNAMDCFKQELSEIAMHCSIAKVLTVSISRDNKVIKQVTSSFINNI